MRGVGHRSEDREPQERRSRATGEKIERPSMSHKGPAVATKGGCAATATDLTIPHDQNQKLALRSKRAWRQAGVRPLRISMISRAIVAARGWSGLLGVLGEKPG
jgi:hypothetical protein